MKRSFMLQQVVYTVTIVLYKITYQNFKWNFTPTPRILNSVFTEKKFMFYTNTQILTKRCFRNDQKNSQA